MVLQTICDELTKSSNKISSSKLNDFIKEINNHKRIFVYGTGRSGLMLKAFAMRLMQMGYTSFVVGETTTPSIEKGDLLIVASASGTTESVVSMAKGCKKNNIDILTITGSLDSELVEVQEPLIVIDSPTKFDQNNSSVQPMGSLFEQMLLVIFDGVILKMVEGNDSVNEMQKRHASLE